MTSPAQLAPLSCAANNARAMDEKPRIAVPSPADTTHTVSQIKPAAPPTHDMPLFHFGLRQLFWFIAVVSTLLAGIVSTSGVTALALLLAALVVALHVFATALGGRLRSDSDKSTACEAHSVWSDHGGSLPADARSTRDLVHRSPWHGRGSTALPWLPMLILAGVLVGGIVGIVLLTLTIGHRTSVAGVIIGSLSAAVLGGWLMFLGGSFYGIVRHGVRDALAQQQKDEARHCSDH